MQCRLSLHCILPSSITLLDIVDILLVPLVGTIVQMQTIHLKATSWWNILKSKQTIWFSQRVQRANTWLYGKLAPTRRRDTTRVQFPPEKLIFLELPTLLRICSVTLSSRNAPPHKGPVGRIVAWQHKERLPWKQCAPRVCSLFCLWEIWESSKNYFHFSLYKRTRRYMIGSENFVEKVQ